MNGLRKKPLPKFQYRPDIDGLRAIAVLAIVLFHLGIVRLEGGFLGVDIFFVISGYLITSIIEPKMRLGSFSFKEFYLKRVRRLIPPALVTILVTFVVAAFILDPDDFTGLSKSAIASVFSVSNILFFTEAGYWDTASDLKPLLHTWSLGVEEQFYLFWPLLVFAFIRFIPSIGFATIFGVVTLLGLALSHFMLQLNPSAAFFLLPARIFEFSIGACFAFIAQSDRWKAIATVLIRTILGIIALIAILMMIWLYDGKTAFPGINAFLPCLATATLLLSGAGSEKRFGIDALLGNSIMTWLGKVSYSMYLVHWPVVSLMRYKTGLELTPTMQIYAVILTLLLTLLLYYCVERRISARAGQSKKSGKTMGNGKFAIVTGIIAISISSMFAHAAINSGWTWRFPGLRLSPDTIAELNERRNSLVNEGCKVGDYFTSEQCDPNKPLVVLVIGDSHERDGINIIGSAFRNDPDLQIVYFDQLNQCEGKIVKKEGLILNDKECEERLDYITNSDFSKLIDIIVYSANKPFMPREKIALDGLQRVKEVNPNIKIITLGPYIVTKRDCTTLVNESGVTAACVDPKNVEDWPELAKRQPLYNDFMNLTDVYIDKGQMLCPDSQPESCASSTPDGTIMMLDTNHLTFEFAEYLGQKLSNQNPNLLRELAGIETK